MSSAGRGYSMTNPVRSQCLRLSAEPTAYTFDLAKPTSSSTTDVAVWSKSVSMNMHVEVVTNMANQPVISPKPVLFYILHFLQWLWDALFSGRAVYIVAVYDLNVVTSAHRIYGVYRQAQVAEKVLEIVLENAHPYRTVRNAGIQELETDTAPFLMATGPKGMEIVGVILKVDVRYF